MSTLGRRRRPLDIWPAFVDAIASLLMVVIFVLLVAAVGQQFLTEAIVGRDHALARLNARIDELADLLAMEKTETTRLASELDMHLASLAEADDALAAQRDTIAAQRTELAERAERIADQSRRLAAMERDRSEIEAQLATLAERQETLRARHARVVGERDETRQRLDEQRSISSAAQARVELLNRQLGELRRQLAELARTLEVRRTEAVAKDARIEELGRKLNLALASKAAQLQKYRSEFFGRLREALSDVPGVRIVGDRFVLPSELLFESASDALGADGRRQVAHLAATLETLIAHIPDDLEWVLRIDGHTDRRPIDTARFPSNWELSAARAISIVRELVGHGIPPERLAATGFAAYHPIDSGDSPAAYARNRRIEIKLTSR